ncbi:MAG: N-acetylglucosamine-6-phosphate deacetylase [Succinivibrio sp.]|nr:N-acetylglucosamine-6-phosphate deacetylase [Succinivibrio sp.]
MLELLNASVYVAAKHAFLPLKLTLEDGRITELSSVQKPADGATSLDLRSLLVIPGLIDLHLHGACGVDTMDGNAHSFETLSAYEASCGVTSLVPTTMTMPPEQILKVCSTLRDLTLPAHCSRLLGIYLEGPYLSQAKCGAQNQDYLLPPSLDLVLKVHELLGSRLKFVAIAPELKGALDFIAELKRRRIRTTIAHTACDYALALKAIQAGADHLTHLFNAMPPLLHRAPGPIGAALDSRSECELIADGYHLSPTVVRAMFKLIDQDKLVLISDSMMATGLSSGQYQLGGQNVRVAERRATLADGTLAGSATNLFDCMTHAVRSMGIELTDAVRACTYNPAQALGEPQLGRLEPGCHADLLVLTPKLELLGIMLNGQWLKAPGL